jgi:competence protein ComEA
MNRILLVLLTAMCLMDAQTADPKKASAAKHAVKRAPAGDLIDINSATAEQLRTMNGVGDAYSAKIIAGRPYRAKDELVERKIIPQATYDKIKDSIIAKQRAKK